MKLIDIFKNIPAAVVEEGRLVSEGELGFSGID